jgi:HTH-type transcriptional regulator/antitoxin HigA
MLVLNDRDYKTAKARSAQLRAALGQHAVVDDLTSGLSAEIAAARREALKAESNRLLEEIGKYEQLRASGHPATEFATDDLGMLPIIARIARRLSQRQLADRIGVSEQQIQRYESDRYSSIGLSRYQKILESLGVHLHPKLATSWNESDAPEKFSLAAVDVDPTVLTEIRKRNWVSLPKGLGREDAGQILATYMAESAGLSRTSSLYRRYTREGTAIDEAALLLWQARVLREAVIQRQKTKARFNIVEMGWLPTLARLSARSDGPLRAADALRAHGIILVFVPHLPRTRLDGAAMLLSDGTPVIALTLRYDRLDSFWFTLFHEIGHILLHFHLSLDTAFIDDLDAGPDNDVEREADLFALSAFIPDQIWETAPARFSSSPELIRRLAGTLGIHPAVVAGRIRRERGDYRLFNELVGNGDVRTMLADQLG